VLSVEDRGVGMSPQVIQNYFLRVGATFCRSEEWQNQHTIDGKGKQSRITRSGKFGIGVLAAFLLGERVEVQTRHLLAADDEGIQFEASLDTDAIQMNRISRPAGTTIRVRLTSEAAAELESSLTGGTEFGKLPSGLYLLDKPTLRYW
jgi:molecular chaperone HtpG